MVYAIKAVVADPRTDVFEFHAYKTMYGGKHIAADDTIYILASENEGDHGLVARGIITRSEALPKPASAGRWTPRVSITVKRTAVAKQPLGRRELKSSGDRDDGRPETELNFKFYRETTNKIVGISGETAAFLESFF
jgi:hypothetical protein